ncbi:MAG: ABC transporter ATP-binding protein [Syntrophales bacterium]|nr:ABC transporter ATP-binding protein [Syntrophales bacterium]
MENIIEAEGLSKVYLRGKEKIPALGGIDLSIVKGEFVSVVGPSGSGKTTLLNLLSCLDTATSGSLRIKKRDVSRLPENKLVKFRREYMGFVFQQFFLLPTLTVHENVELPLLFRRKRTESSKIGLILKTVGLEDRADHLPSQLSGGEMQRVAIGRALINEPEIIFADEPTGNLDSMTGKDIFDLFRNLNQKDITVVVVTHNQELAETADRVIQLLDGKISTVREKNKTNTV